MVAFQLAESLGLGAPGSCSAPARLAGSWVLELGADQFLALDLSRQLFPARHPGEEGRACVYLRHVSQWIPTHSFYHLQPGQPPLPWAHLVREPSGSACQHPLYEPGCISLRGFADFLRASGGRKGIPGPCLFNPGIFPPLDLISPY